MAVSISSNPFNSLSWHISVSEQHLLVQHWTQNTQQVVGSMLKSLVWSLPLLQSIHSTAFVRAQIKVYIIYFDYTSSVLVPVTVVQGCLLGGGSLSSSSVCVRSILSLAPLRPTEPLDNFWKIDFGAASILCISKE